jgi:hypothetical protein
VQRIPKHTASNGTSSPPADNHAQATCPRIHFGARSPPPGIGKSPDFRMDLALGFQLSCPREKVCTPNQSLAETGHCQGFRRYLWFLGCGMNLWGRGSFHNPQSPTCNHRLGISCVLKGCEPLTKMENKMIEQIADAQDDRDDYQRPSCTVHRPTFYWNNHTLR